MTTKEPARHGDVDFIPLTELPEGAVKQKSVTEYIAALGETTGHKHMVKSKEKFDLYITTDDKGTQRLIYLLNAPAILEHEEHRTTTLPAGIYEQKQEIEEDPWLNLTVQVVD